MKHALLVAALALGGCQAQNPYAAFGPAKVPPPGMQMAPYYPPAAPAPPPITSGNSMTTSPRVSITAEPGAVTPKVSFAAEPTDREPIRIVESAQPATRTAAVPAARNSAPSPSSGATPSGYAPAGTAPNYNRTRGYDPPPPSGGQSGGAQPLRSVAPASYEQAARAFTETPAASGGWRAR
jgi:hypothetical protein